MSSARSQGKHYTVKFMYQNKPRGVECLICGLIGDLEYVKGKACSPSPTPTVSDDRAATDDGVLSLDIVKSHQEAQDRRMAQELQELQAMQAELEQLHVLQELEAEELLLQGLLNEQRACNLQAAKAAAYKAQLAVLDPVKPSPENPSPENPSPENPRPKNPIPENPSCENPRPKDPSPKNRTIPENPSPENPGPRVLFPDTPSPTVVTNPILDKKPVFTKLCEGSSESLLVDTKPSFELPYGALDCMGWDVCFVSCCLYIWL